MAYAAPAACGSLVYQLPLRRRNARDSLSSERTGDSVQPYLGSVVVHRHHSAFGSFVLDIAETLRHELFEGQAAVQHGAHLSLRVSYTSP